MARTPDGPPPPPAVQRLRVHYTKRGRLRFSSHRDFQRAFERALRRAAVPMAYSAGFSPHPKVSYAGAAPTGDRQRGRVPRDRPRPALRARPAARGARRVAAARPGRARDRGGGDSRRPEPGGAPAGLRLANASDRGGVRRRGPCGRCLPGHRARGGVADDQERAAHLRCAGPRSSLWRRRTRSAAGLSVREI